MLHIDIITLFPELFPPILSHSILGRAQQKQHVSITLHDLRTYAINRYGSVDDYAYGGGAGMVMMIEPIDLCLQDIKSKHPVDEVIYTAPDGELLSQPLANQLSLCENIVILCGHYKGIDERIREHLITREISIGNYVLSGGELPAAIITDAIVRLVPGVLNDETSALSDSFQNGLLAPPVYTRPAIYNGWEVPPVLLSGHEEKINQWRLNQAMARTKARRPDLLNEQENL